MNIALVNTNRIRPPIAPIGLDYVAEAMGRSEHTVRVFDPPDDEGWEEALSDFFRRSPFDLVGLTLRNTDDCVFTSRQSFLAPLAITVERIRQNSQGLIVLGGVGFSVMPEKVLERSQADVGIWGDGEFAFLDLADRLDRKQEYLNLPGLVWRNEEGWHRNRPLLHSLDALPPMSRRWVDNRRYFREGGQIGFETKRGCSGVCVYCADPVAKGNQIRTRPPKAVVDEIESLIAQGIDHLHTCDSEFNLPLEHALEVCQKMIRRGLGDKLRWYAYCSPVPFPEEFAQVLRRAGCVGINFGTDSGEEGMLKRLGRNFSPEDIARTVRLCKDAGITVMLDLLLGSPGESEESIRRTVELMKRVEPDRVGVAVGVRLYPGTPLAKSLWKEGRREGIVEEGEEGGMAFFLEPQIASHAFTLLDRLIGDDRRFFFFDPAKPEKNYNYNANQRLQEAIGKGYRGAYWDILRRYE